MAQVKMNLTGLGSVVQGNFGTYVPGVSGVVNVDSRDSAALLAAGAVYVNFEFSSYGPIVAATATIARLVASATLANGAVAVANQPDVPRQGRIVIFTGTTNITAGTVSIPYVGNDGSQTTDTFSLVGTASTNITFFTSKGIVSLQTGTIAALAGGASGGIQIDTTSAISVPVNPGTSLANVSFLKEVIETGNETVGTVSTVTLATITPTTIPNSTHTYALFYTAQAPDI